MAAIDYGAIAFKNGKLIQTEMFGDMKEMVGWEDSESDTYCDPEHIDRQIPIRFKNGYFAYVGDSELTACFYKTQMKIAVKVEDEPYSHRIIEEWFGWESFCEWKKWQRWVNGTDVIVTKRNGYYVFRMKYKGDDYKVYFGYGVDFDWYKKRRIVNYYRSLNHYIKKARWRIEMWAKRHFGK